MIGLETGLYATAALAGAVLWYLCVLRNKVKIWRYLGLCCRANEAAEIERRRVMSEGTATVHGAGCVAHLSGRRER